MRNALLLMAGAACLAIGLVPNTPVPDEVTALFPYLGGTLIMLAALQLVLMLAVERPALMACVAGFGFVQYVAVLMLQPGATPLLQRAIPSISEMAAYCSTVVLFVLAFDRFTTWRQARAEARDQALRDDSAAPVTTLPRNMADG